MYKTVPWDFKDKMISVALTGRAFRQICDEKDINPVIYNSVIAKAKVYARMSPDDKS